MSDDSVPKSAPPELAEHSTLITPQTLGEGLLSKTDTASRPQPAGLPGVAPEPKLTGWCICAWTLWRRFDFGDCDLATDSDILTDCTALTWQSTVLMTGLGQGSAIAAYQEQANRMWQSHDENGSLQMNMYSLDVMVLDLSISPDVFDLRAFNANKLVSRMLPGSTPCELRLMLPDAKLGINVFHDVIIENLAASSTWWLSYVTPADIT